jgi:hypothetical protein
MSSCNDLGFSDPNDISVLLDFSQILRDLFQMRNTIGMIEIEEIGSGMGYGRRDLNVRYRDRCLNLCITIDDELEHQELPRHLREKIESDLEETV